jgi:uncharacterized protein (TIGR03032 family)
MDEKTRASAEEAAAATAEKERPGIVVESGGAVPEIAQKGAQPGARQPQAAQQGNTTQIECSRGLAGWLLMNNVSLAFTSYQTGQLFLVGVMPDRRISIHQRNFVRAMGLIAHPQRVYVAGLEAIWRMENVLRRTEVANRFFDRLFVPRNAQVTGDLDVHEMGIDKAGRVIFVNTKYSCLATFNVTHSFRPVWKPKFISKIAPEDRCHLNGMALVDGVPRYVTSVSQSDVLNGWREKREQGGVLIDTQTDRVVTDELSMPHSPRVAGGALWVLDSGRGYIAKVDEKTGKRENVCFCPGFLRGMTIWNGHAIATVSLPRDGTFKNLELEENIKARGGVPWCGIQIVDLRAGGIVEWLRLEGFIKELFDVGVIPGSRCPMALGVGTPEVQHTITFEPDFGPLVLQTPAPSVGEQRPPGVPQSAPAAPPSQDAPASEPDKELVASEE